MLAAECSSTDEFHASSREKGGLAYASPIAFQKKRKALFKCLEQTNCMKCWCWLTHNSTWMSSRDTCKDVSGQLVVFGTIDCPCCVAQPILFSS